MATEVRLPTYGQVEELNEKTTYVMNKVAMLPFHLMQVDGIRYHYRKVVGDTVELQWQDPNDKVVGGVAFADWWKTAIYKKRGSAPTGPDDPDAVLVVENMNRNAYMHDSYVDNQEDGDNWVYRCFTYARSGVINDSDGQIFQDEILFGYKIDESYGDEMFCVEYTDDNSLFSKLYMDFENDVLEWGSWRDVWFMPKPCALKRDGTVAYYLDPNDYTKKLDGTESDVFDSTFDGNFMVEWPTIFTRFYEDDDGKKCCQFSNRKLDDNFECWSCKKEDGTYAEHFYTPIYEGYVLSNVLRSYSARDESKNPVAPTGSTSQANELVYAQNNGRGWMPTLWADEQLIIALGILVCKRLNFQDAIAPAFPVAASLQKMIGTGNQLGMFHGYSDGRYVSSKFFGMENWWGHRWRRCIGADLINGQWKVKMTQGRQDGSTDVGWVTSNTDTDYDGYIATEVTIPMDISQSFIRKTQGTGKASLLPFAANGGSSSTYYCDACWTATGCRAVMFGGSVSNSLASGLFAVRAASAPSHVAWSYGASLSYHTL